MMVSNEPNKLTLDTIRKFCGKTVNEPIDKTHLRFIKRRNAKFTTKEMTKKLMALNSPLNQGYRRAFNCAEYLYQDGQKITSNYCKHRCCTVCNRIVSAKMLNGYAKPLLALSDLHFVTLTLPNVIDDDLRPELDRMGEVWKQIREHFRYKKIPLKGMRKIECTHNYKAKTFNPHYHVLVSTALAAETLVSQWLKRFPEASPKAQNIKKANEGSLMELFKYVTKSIVGGNYSATAMDVIYQAMYQRNTFYRVGIKKYATEEIDDLQTQIITFKNESVDVWKWVNEYQDWITADGKLFVDVPLESKVQRMASIIRKSKITDEKKELSSIISRHRMSKKEVYF